jgi:hypothetical protein
MILSQVRLFQSISHPETGEESFFTPARQTAGLVMRLRPELLSVEIVIKGKSMCTPLTNVRSFVVDEDPGWRANAPQVRRSRKPSAPVNGAGDGEA